LSGNQVNGLVQIPIDVCGNAIGLFGNADAACVGGSTATTGPSTPPSGGMGGYGYGGNGGGKGGPKGDGSKNFMKAFGKAKVATTEGAYGYGHQMGGGSACSPTLNSFGNTGIASGNQINLVAQAPVEISGNAIGVLGNSSAHSVGGAWATC